jgi:hypothetical protein
MADIDKTDDLTGIDMAEMIYCDESGFSGNNLSDDGAPYFVFAGVLIDPQEAEALVSEVKSAYRVQGEMKGANLTKYSNGRKAIATVLERCASKAKVVVADKKFALAGKLFEYIFEPAISANSKFFYDAGFNVFIANILYTAWQARPETAGVLLRAFQESMRSLDQKHLDSLSEVFTGSSDKDSPQNLVLRFAEANKAAIGAEMEDLGGGNPAGRWVLDLSGTCLDGLLASWGETLDGMRVICDSSKPLQEIQAPFTWHVGYSGEKKYIEIGGRKKLLTYSLAEPIAFHKSHEFPGLQLADVIASAISYAMRNRDDVQSNSWLQQIDSAHTVQDTILPDADRARVSHLDGMLNSMLLIELVDRAEKGKPLLPGIERLYARARRELPGIVNRQ